MPNAAARQSQELRNARNPLRTDTMKQRRRFPVVLLMCIALAAPEESSALLQSCSVSATAVNFGLYDPLSGSATQSTGTVTVVCQVSLVGLFVNWTVALSTGSSGNYVARQLQSGANSLSYNLYTNAARTSVWGDGTSGTSVVSANPFLIVGSNTVNYTVYGSIPAAQDRPAGSYTDTLTVTMTY
jgi:spore coat protein U-like protein